MKPQPERSDDSPEHRPGATIAGRFVVTEAECPWSDGFLARDLRTGLSRVVRWAPRADRARFEALRREFRQRISLAHPAIPAVAEPGWLEERGRCFVFLEHVPSDDLTGGLQRVGCAALSRVMALALDAVAYLHANDLVHGSLDTRTLRICRRSELGLQVVGPEGGFASGGRKPTDLRDLGLALTLATTAMTSQSAFEEDACEVLHGLCLTDRHLTYASCEEALHDLHARTGDLGTASGAAPGQGSDSMQEPLRELRAGMLETVLVVAHARSRTERARFLEELWGIAIERGVDVIRLECVSTGSTDLFRELAGRVTRVPVDAPRERSAASVLGVAEALRESSRARPLLVLLDELESVDPVMLRLLRVVATTRSRTGPLIVAGLGSPQLPGELAEIQVGIRSIELASKSDALTAREAADPEHPNSEGALRRMLARASSERGRSDIEEALAEALLRSGQPREAIELVEPRLQQARTVRRLRLAGAAREALGELEHAHTLLEEALRKTDASTPPEERLRVHERLGVVEFRRGELGQARATWQRPLVDSPPPRTSFAVADLLNNLSIVEAEEGRLDEAEVMQLRLLEVRRELRDRDGESRSLTNLGGIASKRGHFAKAARYYEQSLELKVAIGALQAQAVTLANLGSIARVRARYRESRDRLRASLRLRLRLGDRVGELSVRHEWTWLMLDKCAWDRAESEIRRCEVLLEETQARAHVAVQCAIQAEFFLCVGEHERAHSIVATALEEMPGNGLAHWRAILRAQRGRATAAGGDGAAALVDLDHASGEIGEPLQAARIALAKAAILAAVLRFEDSRVVNDSVSDAARSMDSPRLYAESVLHAAELALARDDVEHAGELVAEALRTAQAIGSPALDVRAYFVLGFLRHRTGQPSRARAAWRHGGEVLQQQLECLPRERHDAFLSLPFPRRVVDALQGASPTPFGVSQ